MPPPASRKVISIIAEYPHSLMTGGLQIQADRLVEMLQKYEPQFTYQAFDWMTHQKADLYHFTSTPRYLFDIARLINAAQRPYVATLLLGKRSDFSRWIRDRIKRLLEQQCYSVTLAEAAAVISITERERNSIVASYAVPKAKTRVIPHGVDEDFFEAQPVAWLEKFGPSPFLLCIGAIQPRKNQFLLLQAANQVQAAVVLIGPVLPGKDDYASEVEKEMEINRQWGGHWIRGLPSDSPLLVSAYAACRAFVLLSEHETQPIAVLQAMAAKRPVLLKEAEYTLEPPFDSVQHASTTDSKTLQSTLKGLFAGEGKPSSLNDSFRWSHIARALAELYQTVLDSQKSPL